MALLSLIRGGGGLFIRRLFSQSAALQISIEVEYIPSEGRPDEGHRKSKEAIRLLQTSKEPAAADAAVEVGARDGRDVSTGNLPF